MSLTKLAPSGWAYFAQEIATGREDYYAASAERPGRYVGRGAEAIGLLGEEVTALGLERLIGHGADPREGSPFGRPYSPDNNRVVAGFGLTFSPPKTVSVLWGTGSEEVGAVVLSSHERAVDTALSFLQDHAAFTRQGSGGVFQMDTDGFVGVSFTHRTSRAADPQLHTHVLVANKVRADDGRWRSLDARELYEHQKAAGMLYKAALRAELSVSLGVRWTSVDDNGIAEIEGVPQVLVETWSSRRHAVESLGGELLAQREIELGRELSASERSMCFQLAAYRTRAPKINAETPTAELVARWREEAQAWGQEPERWLSRVLDQHPQVPPERPAEMIATAIARLQDTSATWGRSDAIEVLTTLVGGQSGEAVRARVELLADHVLGDHRVCSLAAPLPEEPPAMLTRRDGMSAIERHGAVRYTTQITLQREARILDTVANGKQSRIGVVPEAITSRVLFRSVLGEDQRRAILELLGGGEQVALLVGPAGVGKSRALDVAREAWEQAGYEPIGLAPSAMAASVLEEEARLSSETLARFLLDLRNGTRQLHARNIVVLDEAAMARTDDLEKVVRVAAEARAKIVLVGDPQQLGAVGPGGMFRTLVGDHGASELETVRRFAHTWEAQASLRLRARDTAVLVEYAERGRIAGGSYAAMRQEAFLVWRAARDEGMSVLVMAGDNKTADAFALRCQQDRIARGEVEHEGTPIANGYVGIGDEIVTLHNDRRLRPLPNDFVRNGDRWQVIDRENDGGVTVASLSERGRVVLPPEYVAEHVALGYALTVHKAQGATVDRAIVLVDSRMTAQQLYVAMSRGREDNRAFVNRSPMDMDDHQWERYGKPTTVEVLADVMRRDGAEHSAHDVLRESFARMDDLDLVRHLLTEARQQLEQGAGPDYRKQIAALEPRADLRWVRGALSNASGEVMRTEKRRADAETALAHADVRSVRAILPGRLGDGARNEATDKWRTAQHNFDMARHTEQEALRAYERARHAVEDAERAAHELKGLRARQQRRDAWLQAHPDAERWEFQLRQRVRTSEYEMKRAARKEQEPKTKSHDKDTPKQSASKKVGLEAEESLAEQAETATKAVLKRTRLRDPGYFRPPEPPPPSPAPRGPVLGR